MPKQSMFRPGRRGLRAVLVSIENVDNCVADSGYLIARLRLILGDNVYVDGCL